MRRIVVVLAVALVAMGRPSDREVEGRLGLPDTSRPCDEVFATRVEVTENFGGTGCKQENGRGLVPIWLMLECDDGGTLARDEFGWGSRPSLERWRPAWVGGDGLHRWVVALATPLAAP